MENVEVQQLVKKMEQLQKQLQTNIKLPIQQLKDSIQQKIQITERLKLKLKTNSNNSRGIATPNKTKKVRLMQVCLDYPHTQYPLSCIKDGVNIAQIARQAGCKDIVQLFDNNQTEYYPNKEDTLNRFIEFCKQSEEGDYLVFQFSGHGQQKLDINGDEPDLKDEQLLLISRDGKKFQYINDDKIAEILTKYLPHNVFCLFIIDACHSHTMLDLQSQKYKGKSVVCISGCLDDQTANDEENVGGFMTTSLTKVLKSAQLKQRRRKGEVSVQQIYERMVPVIKKLQQQRGVQSIQNIMIASTTSIRPQNMLFPLI